MSSTPECISAGDETQQNGANRKKPHARTYFRWYRVRFKSSRLRHARQLKTGARSSTDRASDYGSEGWEFESLRARSQAQEKLALGVDYADSGYVAQ